MKKTLLASAVAALFLTGCAITQPIGTLYTEVKIPVTATSNSGATKEGRATCTSILTLIAIDDCSIATAAKNGSITQIQSVDTEVKNILGIYGTFTTVVKGK